MKATELKKRYLEFFRQKGHAIIGSASLLPENDPTVLFTTAGMHSLVPYLLGEKHPMGNRLVNVQKCIRTQDIDSVGDDTHTTFFEMLGNWSLGEYFKQDAISWSYEFLTSREWLGLEPRKLAVTIFEGDNDCPYDVESKSLWLKLGIPEHKIAPLPKEDNWWGPAGEIGPCGPDTEMFYWTGGGYPPEESHPGNDGGHWMEIWNNVFMMYIKTADGTYSLMNSRNVDTGLGVERVACLLQGKNTVYETELFLPIIETLEKISGRAYDDAKYRSSFRIITDHLRAATFVLGDERAVPPSNVDAGYILRRFIRRAIRHGRLLGIERSFCSEISQRVIEIMAGDWPELQPRHDFILNELKAEEERFSRTLAQGTREFQKMVDGMAAASAKTGKSFSQISGKQAFKLYDTYGFPIEMTEEMAQERGLAVDKHEYLAHYRKHQEQSRAGAEGKFKGGLADNAEKTTHLHTATHLLHRALQIVLGDHAKQRGSNITASRLRFDFSHDRKMTHHEIEDVERIVNEQILSGLDVNVKEMHFEEAKSEGATGLFEAKYGEKVKVYSIGDFSKEICGGPHAKNTRELGKFRILKEGSSSAGVRRIRAILE